jgi:hypothetical protein
MLSRQQARKYRLMSVSDIGAKIRARSSRVVVVGNLVLGIPPLADHLRRNGYRLAERIGGVEIYSAD